MRDRDDRHYLRVGQLFTPFIILGSFCYVPFLEAGMLAFYVDITSTFVVPLLTLFLMGVLTSVNRRSGLIGLLVGVAYGVLRLLAPGLAEDHGIILMPASMVNSWSAYPISMAITAGAMVIARRRSFDFLPFERCHSASRRLAGHMSGGGKADG